MTTLNATLGTVVLFVTFWGAVGLITISALIALSKAFARSRNGIIPPRVSSGISLLAIGLIGAAALLTLPTIFRLTDQTGEKHHPSALEYLASLPDAAMWIVTAAINIWIFALISTVAAIYLRRRQIRRLTAE